MLAVPGEITSALSAGTNALLRLGATPVTCAGDVLELFELVLPEPDPTPLEPAAAKLLERLRDGALTADELVRVAGIDPAQASAALMELELSRKVALEDGIYRVSV